MTVLVTGAGGFLGGHLVDLLLEQGQEVRILTHPDEDVSRLAHLDLPIFRGDIRDRMSLEAALDGADRVLHCAARTGPWGPLAEYRQTNVTALELLAGVAQAAGVRRLVHVSSIVVHGADIRGSGDESAPLVGGPDPYSRTKLEGERVLQRLMKSRQAPITIVRPGLIYGPRDSNSFGRLAALIEQGRLPIIGSGKNHIPLIHVRDVAEGIVLASQADQAIHKTYLLVNDEPVTQLDYLNAIAEELGVAPPHRHVPYRPALAMAGVAETLGRLVGMAHPPPLTRFGLSLVGGENRFLGHWAHADLDFSPMVGLADGVRDSIAWYRSLHPVGTGTSQRSSEWSS